MLICSFLLRTTIQISEVKLFAGTGDRATLRAEEFEDLVHLVEAQCGLTLLQLAHEVEAYARLL